MEKFVGIGTGAVVEKDGKIVWFGAGRGKKTTQLQSNLVSNQ